MLFLTILMAMFHTYVEFYPQNSGIHYYVKIVGHKYGKSPFLIGKSTISMAISKSKLLNYQRVPAMLNSGIIPTAYYP